MASWGSERVDSMILRKNEKGKDRILADKKWVLLGVHCIFYNSITVYYITYYSITSVSYGYVIVCAWNCPYM